MPNFKDLSVDDTDKPLENYNSRRLSAMIVKTTESTQVQRTGNKDSLHDSEPSPPQSPSMYFLVECSFIKNPVKCTEQEFLIFDIWSNSSSLLSPKWYLITLACLKLQCPQTWCILLVSSQSPMPPAKLLLGCTSPLTKLNSELSTLLYWSLFP